MGYLTVWCTIHPGMCASDMYLKNICVYQQYWYLQNITEMRPSQPCIIEAKKLLAFLGKAALSTPNNVIRCMFN